MTDFHPWARSRCKQTDARAHVNSHVSVSLHVSSNFSNMILFDVHLSKYFALASIETPAQTRTHVKSSAGSGRGAAVFAHSFEPPVGLFVQIEIFVCDEREREQSPSMLSDASLSEQFDASALRIFH
jgi:hypothetical protein